MVKDKVNERVLLFKSESGCRVTETIEDVNSGKVDTFEYIINKNNIDFVSKLKKLGVGINDINLQQTLNQRPSKKKASGTTLSELQTELASNMKFNSGEITLKDGVIVPKYTYYKFGDFNESPSSNVSNFINTVTLNSTFFGEINKMFKDVKSYREKVQEALTKALSEKLQTKDNGIGFVPNIRNVLAVIFANSEAFLRLMDDVHTKAWNVRDNKDRRKAVLSSNTSNANADNISVGDNKNLPIYRDKKTNR
jgi:hypothetical protein